MGNRVGGPLGSKGGSGAYGQDHIEPALDQLGSECRVALAPALRPSVVEVHVLPFHVAELLEPLPECPEELVGSRRARAQDANPRDLGHLLSLGGERRGKEAARDARDERTSIHHSIT